MKKIIIGLLAFAFVVASCTPVPYIENASTTATAQPKTCSVLFFKEGQ